jgi:hypothetical protein
VNLKVGFNGYSWYFDGKEHFPYFGFFIYTPWAYARRGNPEVWGDETSSFSIDADTCFSLGYEPGAQFYYFKVRVLGFGIAGNYQGSY